LVSYITLPRASHQTNLQIYPSTPRRRARTKRHRCRQRRIYFHMVISD
jgi:hypothetical protein